MKPFLYELKRNLLNHSETRRESWNASGNYSVLIQPQPLGEQRVRLCRRLVTVGTKAKANPEKSLSSS